MYSVSPTCQIPNLSQILTNVFGENKVGTFIEVGAYDGETFSNTSGLADSGWQGVYVEPVPHLHQQCSLRHAANNVFVLHRAIGKEKGIARISIHQDVSTTNQEYISILGAISKGWEHPGNVVEVEQDTLESLFNFTQEELLSKPIDLLVVDTEGSEREIFEAFPLQNYLPTMIIVELHKLSGMWQQFDRVREDTEFLENYFDAAGYKKIFEDDINTIYIYNR